MLWWADILGALVRWALTALGAYLVQHHVLTHDESESMVAHLVTLTIASAPAIGALAWSIWQKAVQRQALSVTIDALGDALKANHQLKKQQELGV
jgi:hypothetical protein